MPPLIVLLGATATGKTGLSLELAERVGDAEIVSADSRQVYRGMDVGTAKVTTAERARVPHHGLDLADPPEPFTAADFRQHALAALGEIRQRHRVALLVGGTGLYLRAVSRGMPLHTAGHDPDARARLEERLERDGVAALAEELVRIAPGMAARTDLANPRRVVRALERAGLTGDVPPPRPLGYRGPVLWLGLTLEPALHRDRIERRAARQFAMGLLDEAAALRARYGETPRAFSAIGYREAWDVLDGRATLADAIATDALRNRAYARRQRTWFRGESEVVWLDAAAEPLAAAWPLVQRFLEAADRPVTG